MAYPTLNPNEIFAPLFKAAPLVSSVQLLGAT